MMLNPKNNDVCLTKEKVAELFKLINGWEHYWRAIIQKIIMDEISRRALIKENKKLGPYGDWPVDGH
ncbi:MAG: hypothetical protein WC793_00420 [Candidatus Paceibacterota bacterium]|jgi:hypothetical protein